MILDKTPAHDWPKEGNIQFDGMSLRYNDVDQPVLKGISCSIKSKEKVLLKTLHLKF